MCVNLIACWFCVSIRLFFQEYDLEANYLLKDMYAYNIIKLATELDYISEDRVNEIRSSMASNKKKRRTEEGKLDFNQDWRSFLHFIGTQMFPNCVHLAMKNSHTIKSQSEKDRMRTMPILTRITSQTIDSNGNCLDLKTKICGRGKFTGIQEQIGELERPEMMYITQAQVDTLKEIPRVEALIFDAWNSLQSGEEVAYGSADDLQVDHLVRASVSCMNIIKK
ncbi:hypothetical protein HNY73_016946 [Argiope bruennichi]|uniref:Uncharacterized protein n=1 Tax=Argiope bruennichi TaxID=94029 RepID=A0A8T0EKA8_ARGBR|nr:hypothetical protein HNY73_016946 [Argiope bruennichi]